MCYVNIFTHFSMRNKGLKTAKEKKKLMKNNLEKSKFIHLSASYNASIGIEKHGEAIIGNKAIDKIFYVNAPRYANNNQDSYKREDYTHPQ